MIRTGVEASAGAITAQQVRWAVAGQTVLAGVSVAVKAGQVTGLIGPNGSGKTTLLHVMAGLRRPAAGRVTMGDVDVHALTATERGRRIALLEQHSHTDLELTVRDVIALGRTPHLRRGWARRLAAEDEIAIDEAALRAGVDDLLERHWLTLSGGEQQRVQLARAMAQQPSILLLDEPTNHLDIGHRLAFFETVRTLGITVLAALHDLDLAAAYCDEIVVLDHGSVRGVGAPAAIITVDLLAEVYGVDATVTHHSRTGRPQVQLNGTVSRVASRMAAS